MSRPDYPHKRPGRARGAHEVERTGRSKARQDYDRMQLVALMRAKIQAKGRQAG